MEIIINHNLCTEYIKNLRRFLKDNSSLKDRSDVALLFATFMGYLPILIKAKKRGIFQPDKIFCDIAAEGGHLRVLQWLRENECPWDIHTCAKASRNGHFEVLKWARINGCPWNAYTCFFAAYGGHLEVLQWARENGCLWNADTCSYAAYGGHLEVLRW